MINLRRSLFFLIDKIKGGTVADYITDISIKLSATEILTDQILLSDIELKKILNHAVTTTEYYQNYNAENGIESFPIIDKNIIREKTKNFISSAFQKKNLIPAVTSGSTGTPFKSYQNEKKKLRNTADTIYFSQLVNYNIGDKLYYLKIWSRNNNKSKILEIAQNIAPVEVLNLGKDAGRFIKRWNKEKSRINFLGYVSAFETIIDWVENHKNSEIKAKVNSIITMSESLSMESRVSIANHFKTDVFSRYSNIENGIIAQQVPGSEESFLINTASYYVEIIDIDSHQVLPDNRLGRIIVTDLFNKGMPFIRYDTGDLGIKSKKYINGNEYEVFTHIEGRKLDQIFNTKQEAISSYVVYKNMWQYPEISQYQLIQYGIKEYLIKICIEGKFQKENLMLEQFKSYLGSDASISIEYVTDIPLLDSGKRKKVVNLMTNR